MSKKVKSDTISQLKKEEDKIKKEKKKGRGGRSIRRRRG